MGSTEPRICPPRPVRTELAAFQATAESIGIELMPWQKVAGKYLTARNADGTRPYREVAIVVARQNGKTTLMKPYIVQGLRAGKRIVHIAHDRNLPRTMFDMVADALSSEPELFPRRRGKVIWPRYGAGQEEIVLVNGGSYRIAASRTGGARGRTNDIVIIDELREMESFDVINAAEPTLMMSPDPLMVYLSNAGTDQSVVLNSVQERALSDPGLAYLEWSAPPGMDPGDRKGWAQANPALGHQPTVLPYLESAYTRHRLAQTMATFETEHLCRSATSLQPSIVSSDAWEAARGDMPDPGSVRPVMGIKVDPDGRRASAVIAWSDGEKVYIRSFAEDTTVPLDVDAFGKALLPLMRKHRVVDVVYDPWTDRALARHFKDASPTTGQAYQAACTEFVRRITALELVHDDDGVIGDDLAYTVRRDVASGWLAVRAGDARPTTACEAAIRAVWLASEPRRPRPRIH